MTKLVTRGRLGCVTAALDPGCGAAEYRVRYQESNPSSNDGSTAPVPQIVCL